MNNELSFFFNFPALFRNALLLFYLLRLKNNGKGKKGSFTQREQNNLTISTPF